MRCAAKTLTPFRCISGRWLYFATPSGIAFTVECLRGPKSSGRSF